jgi:AAHS family 4-hydroxybenzoate transporter-like MFS transporter
MPAARTIDVQAFLNEHPFSPFQWLIFALCFCVVLMDGFDTAAIGYIAPSLISEWGVERSALGPVLSAALFGLVVGSLSAGPLADRFGRKTVLSIAVLIFGLACLASAFSAGLNQLVAWRFVTGVGLGAAMPNAVTMMNEYCPEARRATLTNAMFCGFPLGAALGGFIAAWMIPYFGWRSVLILGGVAPLIIGSLIIFLLPESVRYMVAKNYPAERISEALRRVQPAAGNSLLLAEPLVGGATEERAQARNSIGVVLSRELLVGSVMLWLAYFMGLVIFYALVNWMPVLLKDAGVAASTAALVSALFPLGGFGAILSGWLMDRFNANLIIAACFALTAAAVYAIGQSTGHIGLLMLVVLGAGTIMNTAQSSLPTLAAAFYPTDGRATGVSWMMGIGRFGGIAGSFLVAELSGRNLSFSQIFTIIAISGLVAAIALVIKQLTHPETKLDYSGNRAEVLGH